LIVTSTLALRAESNLVANVRAEFWICDLRHRYQQGVGARDKTEPQAYVLSGALSVGVVCSL
jgi:hypothetical protein